MMLDSFAWMEYFMGTEKGEKVREIVESDTILYASPVILAEIYSKSQRVDGSGKERVEFILNRCVVVEFDDEIGVEAGRIHAEMKSRVRDFGMIDALIIASARKRGLKILTGDKHFEHFENVVML